MFTTQRWYTTKISGVDQCPDF